MQKIPGDKSYSVKEISEKLDAKFSGDGGIRIQGLCSIENAAPNLITFLKLESESAVAEKLKDKKTSVVLLPLEHQSKNSITDLTAIFVADPYRAFLSLVPLFYEEIRSRPGISSNSQIDPSAKIGKDVHIGSYVVIGEGVEIGDNVEIFDNVSIYKSVCIGNDTVIHSGTRIREFCEIGSHCTLHNNITIGADGFGYVPGKTGLEKVPQVGRVIIGDNVEIGASTTIDRGAFGNTVIGRGTKIDNQVQIGHNVQVGENVILCGQVGIAGSVVIGSNTMIGGAVGIGDHLKIASGVRIAGKSAVTSHLDKPGDYAGYPAIPAREWRKQFVIMKKLPELFKKLKIS